MNGRKYCDREEEKDEKKLVCYVKSDNTIDLALRLDGPHIYLALVVFSNFFLLSHSAEFRTANFLLGNVFSTCSLIP